MTEKQVHVCCLCGREGTQGFKPYGQDQRCVAWRTCADRCYRNERLITRAEGSIRYSGDTFDRVERLRAMGLI